MIPAGYESKAAYDLDDSFYDDDDEDEDYSFAFSSNNKPTLQSQPLNDSNCFEPTLKGEEENRTFFEEFNNNSYDYANKNDTQEPKQVDTSLEELDEKIRRSVRQKNLEQFKLLFESNKLEANMVITKTANWSLLMYAVSNGAYEICEFLLENGADSTYTDDSFSLLMCACACEDSHVLDSDLVNIVQLLIEHNADVNQTDKLEVVFFFNFTSTIIYY